MKKFVLFIVIAAFGQSAFAQTFSGGVKTGVSLWFTKDYDNKKLHFPEGQNMT